MGSGLKNKKGPRMGDYMPTDEEVKAYVWCVNNHIKISPKAIPQKNEWKVDIQQHSNKVHTSKEAWGPKEIWQQIYTYYEYYYNKRNGV